MRRTIASFYFLGSTTLAFAQPQPPPAPTAPPGDQVSPVPPEQPPAPPLGVEQPPLTQPPPPEVTTTFVPPDDDPPTVERTVELKPTNGKTEFTLDGYLQPQFRARQNSSAQEDTNGFKFARVRPQIRAATKYGKNLEFNATFEVELQPAFEMLDAYIGGTKTFKGDGFLTIDVGQMRVPISRQQLLSDSRLQFVDKAQLQSIAPRRDIGARVTFVPPELPQLKVFLGAFDGEGQNNIENIDEKFLYAARVAVTVLGKETAFAEGAFGGDYLTISGSGGRNGIDAGDRTETIYYYGGDIVGAYKGISGSFEVLQATHSSTSTTAGLSDFTANGFAAQLAYLLPVHLWRESRLEVGARVEEVDRNDTVPIVNPGDPEQSLRIYTGVATYYLRKHSLKAAVAYSHFQEIEDMTVAFTPASYDNDQVILQLTYRME